MLFDFCVLIILLIRSLGIPRRHDSQLAVQLYRDGFVMFLVSWIAPLNYVLAKPMIGILRYVASFVLGCAQSDALVGQLHAWPGLFRVFSSRCTDSLIFEDLLTEQSNRLNKSSYGRCEISCIVWKLSEISRDSQQLNMGAGWSPFTPASATCEAHRS